MRVDPYGLTLGPETLSGTRHPSPGKPANRHPSPGKPANRHTGTRQTGTRQTGTRPPPGTDTSVGSAGGSESTAPDHRLT